MALVHHLVAVDIRNELKTNTSWPDLSDIGTITVERINRIFVEWNALNPRDESWTEVYRTAEEKYRAKQVGRTDTGGSNA